ncbi:MAG: class I SAM-dependent methyltransferase [Patescibacteria group bacterium]
MIESLKILLKELEQTREEFWNITPEAGQFLNFLIKDRKYKKVLEIGTSNGYSGIWLAEALKQTGGHLYTIESNKKIRYPIALANFQKSGLTKYITPILGHAPEDLPKTPLTFDMAFFDATKKDHIRFFEVLEKRIHKGGMIVTDNIISHAEPLAPYIKAIKKNEKWFSVTLNIGAGLMLSYKVD